MRAFELISEEIPPLVHTDTGEKAMIFMDEFKVSHLPVLKNGQFVGLVSESEILDRLDVAQTLDHLFSHLGRPYVHDKSHIYEVLTKMSDERLSVIPILDEQENYVGCTSIYEVMTQLAKTGSFKEVGGIIVLQINTVEYSLAEISQIVESNNARILSVYILSDSSSSNLEVTLKINQMDLTRIIRTFERYDYLVKTTFQKGFGDDDLKNRYDSLMNYLNQ